MGLKNIFDSGVIEAKRVKFPKFDIEVQFFNFGTLLLWVDDVVQW